MKDIFKLLLALLVVALLAGGVIGILNLKKKYPSGDNQQAASQTIKLMSKPELGDYLADTKGMALYYFPKDTIGKSNCSGGCLTAWPIFYSDKIVAPSGVDAKDFGEIVGTDNKKQSTYKGWPLYYYYQDINPGDTKGEGVGDVWYVIKIPFYSVMTANKPGIDNYLIDNKGMALYRFVNDKQGTASSKAISNCAGQCLANWPAFYAKDLVINSLLKNSDFSEIERTGGAKQLVYKGWPLYYYVQDTNPGDAKGDKFNNVWFLAKP